MPDPVAQSDGLRDLKAPGAPAPEVPIYRNPKPVVVFLVPIQLEDAAVGLLTVRRKLADGLGKLALPGGYQNEGEPWRGAGTRELKEETTIVLGAEGIEVFDVADSTGCKQILIFGITPPQPLSALESFEPNDEVSELVVITKPEELAFATHTEMARKFFERRG